MSRRALVLRIVLALLAAIACAIGVVALAHGAVGTARGQRLDQLVMTAARGDTGVMAKIVFPVLNTVTVPVIVVAILLAAVLALAQRRASMIVHIVVLVGGAALSTQLLKHVIVDRTSLADGLDVTPNSYPSGHTTMAAAVAVALTLASPRHVRSLVALLGAAWTAIAGIGTIAGGWHRPSDVLGGLLVVGAWSYLVLAADAVIEIVRHGPGGALTGTSQASARHRPEPEGQDGMPGAAPDGRSPRHAPRTDPARAHPPRPDTSGAGALGIGILGAAAVLGLGIGTLCLTGVPTPLDLDDPGSQTLAYAATVLIIAGAASALLCWLLVVHIPTLSGPPPARRVR
ncbi:phosphatase PAP2 family protein [Brachybacterium sp. AOP25-B2-12]|uniref:phosphatase PAP2 family protein n=1 Tax=Brachybacterium sp. AOP25-B2-12 TaxID=3457710 RepID=UPI004034C5F7